MLAGDAEQGTSLGPVTTFTLYDPDPTPLYTVDGGNVLQCSVTYDPRDPYADFNADAADDLSLMGLALDSPLMVETLWPRADPGGDTQCNLSGASPGRTLSE